MYKSFRFIVLNAFWVIYMYHYKNFMIELNRIQLLLFAPILRKNSKTSSFLQKNGRGSWDSVSYASIWAPFFLKLHRLLTLNIEACLQWYKLIWMLESQQAMFNDVKSEFRIGSLSFFVLNALNELQVKSKLI